VIISSLEGDDTAIDMTKFLILNEQHKNHFSCTKVICTVSAITTSNHIYTQRMPTNEIKTLLPLQVTVACEFRFLLFTMPAMMAASWVHSLLTGRFKT